MKIFLTKNSHSVQNLSMKFLKDEERINLRLQHKKERDGRVRDRIKAILLYDRGKNKCGILFLFVLLISSNFELSWV